MTVKKTKIVCVYQDLSNLPDVSRDFAFNANLDFEAKECIVRQITYSSLLEDYIEFTNTLIWCSLNNDYIGSFIPNTQSAGFYYEVDQKTGDYVVDANGFQIMHNFHVSSFSASPNTLIMLSKSSRITEINFSLRNGSKAPSTLLNGEFCIVLEFRE